ncbi:9714_t:CDS:2, partial [Funneliformis geosporum]
VFLHKLVSKGDIFTICALFGITEGTIILYTKQEVLQGFRNISDFQNIIDAIDGSHIILINKPPKDPEVFFNRKKHYSIQVQAIVNHREIFTNYVISWP